MDKRSAASVPGLRQQTQFTCMATSIAACLQALGKPYGEEDVNKVLGAEALRGARWEEALATLQYFGCRGSLVVPSTLAMLKSWTDQGLPVMIAWNPEGRPWSHASVVSDVSPEGVVKVMDPNIPDPNQNFRLVPSEEFYKKWGETIEDMMVVRRPALMVSLEVSREGRQVVASVKTSQIGLDEFRTLIAAEHSKGEVWRTDEGKWRSIGPSGDAKSFDSQDQAKTYAKGKDEEKPEKSESLKGKLTGLFNKIKGMPDQIKKDLSKASDTVKAIMADPESRKRALSSIAQGVVKAGANLPKTILDNAKKEIKDVKTSVHAIKKLFKKPPEKMDHEDKKALFSVGVYVAGAVLAAIPPGGAVVAAGAVGKSFAKHVALKVVHQVLDTAFLQFEAGETVLEGAHAIGHHLFHGLTASEKVDENEELIKLMTEKVGEILKGISDEDMESILKGEDPESKLDDLPSEPKGKEKKASGGVMDKAQMITASEMAAILKDAKFPKGETMTIDEVAKVVGPEFKEMNVNPPESVQKVKENMAGKTAAQGNDPIWVVRDPGPDSEMEDILYETTVPELASLAVGTTVATWKKENTAIYFRESEATKDAKGRMQKMGKKACDATADDKQGRFEEGKPADPTENMSPTDAAEWKKQNEAHKDEFKAASSLIACDQFAELLKDGRFEEGKPADPTENMSPADAAEWRKQNEAHKDEFKGASSRPFDLNWGMRLLKDYFLNGVDHAPSRASSIRYLTKVTGNPAFAQKVQEYWDTSRPDLHGDMFTTDRLTEELIRDAWKATRVEAL